MSADPDYRPRVVDEELRNRLAATGAVLIEGPKACGKTATARQQAASEVLLDIDENARQAASVLPEVVLEGPAPRLIDEWQVAPAIWNHVRRAAESRRQPGQFILTGSAVPPDDITRHSGAGRITRLQMRPMSLYETGVSTGTISLAEVLAGQRVAAGSSDVSVQQIADEIAIGGWPGFRELDAPRAIRAVRDYLREIARVDVGRVDDKRRDPARVEQLLRSLARSVSTFVSNTTLASDTGGTNGALDRETIADYLSALQRLMVIENQPAWAPHLRSRYAVRAAEKRLFVDPSLAVAALRASPAQLLRDLNFFGFLFESLVVRDLRIYAQANDARVLHYHDDKGGEVDAIIETSDGRWAGFEIKLGGDSLVDEGVESLRRFISRVNTHKSGPPACLGVIVATGYAYQRPDGIAVLPLTVLRP